MQDFTPEQIKERFDSLSPEMRAAVTSDDILGKMQGIASKQQLGTDQTTALIEHVALVMLGLAHASDFVKDISAFLSIDATKAKGIADDINAQVFDSLKKLAAPAPAPSKLSAFEQAGGFELEPEISVNGEDLPDINARGFSAFSSGDKAETLSGIENPVPTAPHTERKIYNPVPQPQAPKPAMTEPLVDQLLKAAGVPPTQPKPPVAAPVPPPLKPPVQAPRPPQAPQPPTNLPTNDPYREGMK